MGKVDFLEFKIDVNKSVDEAEEEYKKIYGGTIDWNDFEIVKRINKLGIKMSLLEVKIKEELANVEWVPLEEIISCLEKEGKIKMMPGSKNVIKVYLKGKKLI